MSDQLLVQALPGIGEVAAGDDLVALLETALRHNGVDLRDGDVVLVTSKVVSKAEDRVVSAEREEAVSIETVRVVARRGTTRIVENRQGLVMAAAGVDASNVMPGRVVLLPLDPDASARALRQGVLERTGHNVAVVVTDTAGRAWRTGQTDIAIGAAGMAPLEDFAGQTDGYGNLLAVTAPAVLDELAGAAELVTGKLGARPLSIARGMPERVLPPGQHGPGARALQRPREQDLFALGAREAVVAALTGTEPSCFGAPATTDDMAQALRACGFAILEPTACPLAVAASHGDRVLAALLHAHGWHISTTDSDEGHLRVAPLP